MTVLPTAIPDVLLIEPRRFGDRRGFFSETYNRKAFSDIGITSEFVQDNQSLSGPVGVLRGLHFQAPPKAQDKLVRCTRGAILDVAVDIRHGSPTFGRWVAAEISADNWRQIFVPKGFAHGFVTLLPETEVCYKVSDYYSPADERGIRFDDPALGIDWRIDPAQATLSDRDRAHPALADLPVYFRYEAPRAPADAAAAVGGRSLQPTDRSL